MYDRVITAEQAAKLFEAAGLINVRSRTDDSIDSYTGPGCPLPRCYVVGTHPTLGTQHRADGGYQAIKAVADAMKAEIDTGVWSAATMERWAGYLRQTKWWSAWPNAKDGTIALRYYGDSSSKPVIKVVKSVEEARAACEEGSRKYQAERDREAARRRAGR